MGIDHIFHRVCYDVSGRQGIEHSVVAHCDSIVNCDGIELSCKTSLGFNFRLDYLAYFVKMSVTRNKLGERIHYGNYRSAHLFLLHSCCYPQGSGSGHSSAVLGHCTSEFVFHSPFKLLLQIISKRSFRFSGKSAPVCFITRDAITFPVQLS